MLPLRMLPCIFPAPLFSPRSSSYCTVLYILVQFLYFSLYFLFHQNIFFIFRSTCLHPIFFYLPVSFLRFLILSLSLMNHVEACFHTLLMEALWHAHILHTFITSSTKEVSKQTHTVTHIMIRQFAHVYVWV